VGASPGRESPDDPQCRLSAVRAGVGRRRVAAGSVGLRCRFCDRQRPADLCQASSPAAIGQKAVVTDPHQPLGQDMQQEAAHEFLAIEDERLVSVAVAVVLVAQSHLVVVHGEDTGVADGDPACVARQVAHHRVGVFETVLAVDHPLGGHQGAELIINVTGPGDPVEFAAIGGLAQGTHQVPTKVARQGPDREQVGAARLSPDAIVAQRTAGHQAVQVHMLAQGLAPGVEHRAHAHLAAEALGMATKGSQRLPGALEQQPVDHLGMKLDPAV